MEPESSLPHSQVPTTCPYYKPARSSPYPHIPLPEDPYIHTYIYLALDLERLEILMQMLMMVDLLVQCKSNCDVAVISCRSSQLSYAAHMFQICS